MKTQLLSIDNFLNKDEFKSLLEIEFDAKVSESNIDEYYEEILYLMETHFFVEETFRAIGGHGEYNVEIRSYGPIYWIYAPEFEDIGYFDNKTNAVDYARSFYETLD